jgi:NADH-quinone oxidoreductase subunit H
MALVAYIIIIVAVVLGLLVTIAFMTLIERKLISATQNRKGPNVVGVLGILQPFADAAKLIVKESIYPRNARLFVFMLAPFVSLFFALLAWAFIPFDVHAVLVDTNLGMFFVFACSILHVYGVILAGWASGSRYSFLGALRSTAQLIAYDISIGVTICCIVFYTHTMNLSAIVKFQLEVGWFVIYLPLLFVIFFIASLAETNRHPFDLPEAESELVGGYTTEYSAAFFALFFLGEYRAILVMVFLINHLFLGGWGSWEGHFDIYLILYTVKILSLYYIFILVRAAIPRYRYDQLMRLGWKFVLPLCLGLFFLIMITNLIMLGTVENIDVVRTIIWFARRLIFPYLILDWRDLGPFFA